MIWGLLGDGKGIFNRMGGGLYNMDCEFFKGVMIVVEGWEFEGGLCFGGVLVVVRGGEFFLGFYYFELFNISGKGVNRCWLLVGGCEIVIWVGKWIEDVCYWKVYLLIIFEDVCVVFVVRISVD